MLNENEGRSAEGEPQPKTSSQVTCYLYDGAGTITPMEAYKRYFDDKKCQHCNLRCVDLVREGI